MVFYVLKGEELVIVFKLNGLWDWVIYGISDSVFSSEETMGIAALCTYGT